MPGNQTASSARQRRMIRPFLAALTLALVVAACGDEATLSSGDDPEAAREPGAAWELLPASPLSPRAQAAIAWTGSEVVVFGGTTFLCPPNASCSAPDEDPSLADGAAYDPRSGSWRPIAPAPMAVPFARPVALGEDVFALVTPFLAPRTAEPSSTLLRYRSADDAWDAFEVPSEGPVDGLVATTSDLVVFHRSDEHGEQTDLRFDPTDGSWTQLPADPLSPSFDRHVVAVDDRLVLLAKDITPSPGGADGPSFVRAAVFDDGVWNELPAADAIGYGPIAVGAEQVILAQLGCADGGATNGYGRCVPNGGVLDLAAGTWSPLPGPPTSSSEAFTSGVLTDAGVTLWSLGNDNTASWFLDATTTTWTTVPAIDRPEDEAIVQRDVAGAGPYGVVFGGSRFGPDSPRGELMGDAYLWRP